MKKIPDVILVDLTGAPYPVAKRSENGRIIWLDEKAGIAQVGSATISTIIKTIIFQITRDIWSPSDPLMAPLLYSKLLEIEDGYIELPDKVYNWLHELLRRPVPLTPEDKENQRRQQTFGDFLLGLNARVVIEQLKPEDERRDIESLEG